MTFGWMTKTQKATKAKKSNFNKKIKLENLLQLQTEINMFTFFTIVVSMVLCCWKETIKWLLVWPFTSRYIFCLTLNKKSNHKVNSKVKQNEKLFKKNSLAAVVKLMIEFEEEPMWENLWQLNSNSSSLYEAIRKH